VPDDKIVHKFGTKDFEEYANSLLDPAVEKLKGLRFSCKVDDEETPIRMLVTVSQNKIASQLATYLNKRSESKGWDLFAAAITGDTDQKNVKLKNDFAYPSEPRHRELMEKRVDIAVQCRRCADCPLPPHCSVCSDPVAV
jgi:hypothetical protein